MQPSLWDSLFHWIVYIALLCNFLHFGDATFSIFVCNFWYFYSTINRELTKKHETAFGTTLKQAAAYYEANDPRGECVIVMEGRSREELKQEERSCWEEMAMEEHVAFYEKQGMNRKEAMKQAAKDRGISKREVYAALLQ